MAKTADVNNDAGKTIVCNCRYYNNAQIKRLFPSNSYEQFRQMNKNSWLYCNMGQLNESKYALSF